MYKRGDFHLHTYASDGQLSPIELIKLAKQENLDVIAITDHDTISSVEEAKVAGKAAGIKVIPGIELSATHNEESVHILGYFTNEEFMKPEFREILMQMVNYRSYRAKKIIENLYTYFNISLNYNDILESAKGVIARPHIAKAIIDSGYDYTWSDIFNNIINETSPAYVPKKNLTLEEGINLLKSVNALAVLAHPVLIKNSTIEELLSYNFDGIEAIYPLNTEDQTSYFISMAKAFNKFITAGSDFHGISAGDKDHGYIGCVSLNDNNLELFLEEVKNKAV